MAAAEQAARGGAPALPPAAAGSGPVAVAFEGRAGDLFGLLVKGFLLQIVTLGLYRFWLTTDLRRFYWSHTAIGREPLVYTGRGMELFKGFLIALAILAPIQAASFFLALNLPSAETLVSAGLFFIYLFLGQYAVYAGRRYRLTRTAFRGLRLRMSGSAWSYAVKGFVLSLAVGLTLGLAYPWAAAALERIKMRETWYGDAQGDFVGTAGELLRRGLLIWALGFGLPLALVAAAVMAVPRDVWSDLFSSAMDPTAEPSSASLSVMAGVGAAASGALVIALLLFPAFQTVVFRWRMNGIRIGGAALSSGLSMGTAYRVYALGMLAMAAVAVVLVVLSFMVFGASIAALVAGGGSQMSVASGLGTVALLIAGYIIVLGGLWVAKKLVIDLRLQRALARSLTVGNLAALDHVRAHNVDASALGDSLGAAVDVGFGF